MPYLMSSHPGSTLDDAINLAVCLKRDKYAPEQVQDYYPTPGTASTVMYYTGINPLDMKPVYVATDYHEKQLQRALLQYNRPQNADLVREALIKAGREDLIGYSEECLVRPAGAGKAPSGKAPVQSQRKSGKPVPSGANKSTGKSASGKTGAKTPSRPANKPSEKASGKPSNKPSGKTEAAPKQKLVRKAGWAKPKSAKKGKK